MKFALVAAVALSVIMAVFAVQNAQTTQVTFLKWYFDGSLVIVLIFTFGAGVLTAFLAMLPGSVRKSIEISKLTSRLAGKQIKIESLEEQLQQGTTQEKEPNHDQQRRVHSQDARKT